MSVKMNVALNAETEILATTALEKYGFTRAAILVKETHGLRVYRALRLMSSRSGLRLAKGLSPLLSSAFSEAEQFALGNISDFRVYRAHQTLAAHLAEKAESVLVDSALTLTDADERNITNIVNCAISLWELDNAVVEKEFLRLISLGADYRRLFWLDKGFRFDPDLVAKKFKNW